MNVNVRVSSLLQKFTNRQEIVVVTGDTAIECLRGLEAQFPSIREWLYNQQGELLSHVQVFVNGERAYTDELTNPLRDGDEVFIVLAISGG